MSSMKMTYLKLEMDVPDHELQYCSEMQLNFADIQKIRSIGCPASFLQFWTAIYAGYVDGQENGSCNLHQPCLSGCPIISTVVQ